MARPASTGARPRIGSYSRGHLIQPGSRAAGAVYRPRSPTATPLYPVVQHHLETFLVESAEAEAAPDQTPPFDVTDPEPIPELDFDQSLPEEFDD